MARRIPRDPEPIYLPKGAIAGRTSPVTKFYPIEKESIMDLSDSVIIPREDFQHLSEVAYNKTAISLPTRVAQTTQITLIWGGMAVAVIGIAVGTVRAQDWLEERRLKRDFQRRAAKSA